MFASANRVSIGSDNGLSPILRQAIIWASTRLLLIESLGTNFSEIWVKIQNFSFKKMHFENVVSERAAILSRGRLVNCTHQGQLALMSVTRSLTERVWSHQQCCDFYSTGNFCFDRKECSISISRNKMGLWSNIIHQGSPTKSPQRQDRTLIPMAKWNRLRISHN